MRTVFHGYFPLTPAEQARLWREALIVLDTNALLNLYRYTPKARDELLTALERFADRLWIPHRVGLEFHSRRVALIRRQHQIGERISDVLNTSARTIEGQLGEFSTNAIIETQEIIATIQEQMSTLVTKVTQRCRDTASEYGIEISSDQLLERVASLYDQRVGREYTEAEMLQVLDEGEARYQKDIPPGYRDKKKEHPEKFGDFIIWKQILEHAKESQRDAILVTDDAKEDWWWRFEGKTIGPRPELRTEFRVVTGRTFYSYRTERFVEILSEAPGSQVSSDVVAEVRKTSKDRDRAVKATGELAMHRRRDALVRSLEMRQALADQLNMARSARDRELDASAVLAESVRAHESIREYVRNLVDCVAYTRGRLSALSSLDDQHAVESELQKLEMDLATARAREADSERRTRAALAAARSAATSRAEAEKFLRAAAQFDIDLDEMQRHKNELRQIENMLSATSSSENGESTDE